MAKILKIPKVLQKEFQELGMDKDQAKNVESIYGPNIFLYMTKGIQYLHETIELCREAFEEAMKKWPLADEKCMGVKVKLMDAKLHEDSIHRGPAQVIPAVRQAIYGAMCVSQRMLLEPKQRVFINVPQDVMGAATSEMQGRRGTIEDMTQEGDMVTIKAKAPVSEMFGFSNSMRSVTGGRALWSTENSGFERIPRELQEEVVSQIRTRKGLKPEPYDVAYYSA